MYIGVISMRYAKALLAYADEKGTEDTVYEEAGILADSSRESPNSDRHWIILYCLLKQS